MTDDSDACRQLLTLLGERPDTVALVDIVANADQHDAGEVESALASILAALRSGGRELGESFWVSPAGQLVAAAQWKLYGGEAILPIEAARLVYAADIAAGKLSEDTAMHRIVRAVTANKLPVYRRPESAFKRHRKDRRGTRAAWYLRRSEVVSRTPNLR